MSARLKESLMMELVPPQKHPSAKISIVGVGQVGMASAYSTMLQVSGKHDYVKKTNSIYAIRVLSVSKDCALTSVFSSFVMDVIMYNGLSSK